MKKRNGKNNYSKQIILFAVILGLAISVWKVTFGGPTVSQKKAQEVISRDCDYKYFYNQLGEDEQQLYEKMFYTVTKFNKEVKLDTKDVDVVQKIYESMFYDHPELYYINSQFQYRLQGSSLIFVPIYDYHEKEVQENLEKIEEKTKDILNQVQQENTSLNKAKMIYDYIVENVEYGKNEKTDQNILSSLLDGQSVCAGYARAYQYLLNKAGIEAVYMVGSVNASFSQTYEGEGHAWVMLHIDDDYYYSDPTWGDVIDENMAHTCYGYFLMNSHEMLNCYNPETTYEETQSTKNLYYDGLGCYMSTYSEKIVSQAIQKGLENETNIAEVKCGSEAVYQQLKKNIQNTYLGYKLLKAQGCWSNKCTYRCIDELFMVELYY